MTQTGTEVDRAVESPSGKQEAPVQPAVGIRLPRGLAAFRHRDYRIFWFVQLGSLTGTWMQSLAQSWLVISLTDSAIQLGVINAFQFGPMMLLGLPAGVVADRIPKRRLLLVTQTLAGTIVSLLAILVATDAVQLWHLYVAALALGTVNAFDMPARQAFVAELVGKDDLMNAVAMNSALFNTTRILGPAIAGVLLAQVGVAICFVINAISYAPVVVGLALMRRRAVVPAAVGATSVVARLREGLAYVRATPPVLVAISMVGMVATFGMNFSVWVPLLARNEFDAGADGFGLLMSAMGVGSLAGALALAFRGGTLSRRRMLTAAFAFGVLEGCLAIAAAIPVSFTIAVPLLVAVGFTMSSTLAMANTLVQTSVPDILRGRVMSIYMTVFSGTLPIGALLAGFTSSRLGAPASIASGGIIVILTTITIGIMANRPVASAVVRPEPGRPSARALGTPGKR